MANSTGSKGQALLGIVLQRLLKIFSLDSRSLALFRVWIAATTISDVLTRFPDAHHHYSDSGMFPREFILRSFTNYYWITLHMLSGAELVIQFLFIIELIIAFCMLVGYRTRTMTILSWIFVCSVQNRNYVLGHSGDTVHRLFLFVGIMLPLSRHFSVDRALECARTGRDCDELERDRERERRKLGIPGSHTRNEIVSFGTALFVFQLLAMYFMAHHHKTGAEWREKGIAAWMALQLDYFRTWFGDILLIWTPGLIFGNYAVLAWQYWGSLIYFMPFFNEYFKALTCLGFFAMHAGFGMAFYLETFTWATLAAVSGIIPTFVWELGLKMITRFPLFSKSITIYVTSNCKTCLSIARILDECMLPGKSKLHVSPPPSSSHSCSCGIKCHDHFLGISVTDSHKNTFHGPAALGVIARNSPVLFPLHYLFKIGPVRKACHLISRAFHSHPINSGASDKIEDGDLKFAFRGSNDEFESKFAFRPHSDTFGNSKEGQGLMELTNVVVDSVPTGLAKKEFFEDRSQNFTFNDVKDASKIGMTVAKEICLACLVLLILSCNAGNLNSSYGVPPTFQPILWVFQLDQYWGMFAPRPPDITWWYNFEGYLDDGTHVELFNDGAMHTFTPNIPHTFNKPNVHESIGNHRWFKLFENGLNSHSQREEIRLYFGRWFCREYNSRYKSDKRVHKFSIHFMYERLDMAKMDGSRFPQAKETIWNHLCYEK